MAASNSFSGRHGTLSTGKSKSASTLPSKKRSTATLLSKTDIISTPVMTAKFDCTPLDAIVIENQRQASVSTASGGGSRPNTPRDHDIITNHVTMEMGQSQSSSEASEPLRLESYLARYNYTGGTDIELPLMKGEIVSVLEKGESGWWQGVCGGRVGWFPASYVKSVPARDKKADVKVEEEVKKEGGEGEEGRASGLLGMEESLKSDTVDATGQSSLVTTYCML